MSDDDYHAPDELDIADSPVPDDYDPDGDMARIDADDIGSTPENWDPDHELCGDYITMFCNGLKIEMGRVFRDTQEDRFMAVREMWERGKRGIFLKEVVPDDDADNGFRHVADGDTHEFKWPDEGGRYIPV